MSITLGFAVAAVVYLVNGSVGIEFMVLGAIIGLAYWYWGSSDPLF